MDRAKIRQEQNEPVIDHVTTCRGNLLFDIKTHFARGTKRERIRK
ncbi:MAG TPA: hypothetical protein VFZ67_07855 [Nitrososphaera sp.]